MAKKHRKLYEISDLPERERPVNRLRDAGTDGVSNAELIACILQTKDALNQANVMLTEFGGFAGLGNADEKMLMQVYGIGRATAIRLIAAIELGRRILLEPNDEQDRMTCPQMTASILIPLIGNEEQEKFVVLFLNTRNEIMSYETLYTGTVNTSPVRISEVFRTATRRNAVSIIIAHNHPFCDPKPSPEDIALTRKIVAAGKMIEIDVLDHIVVGRGRYISMRERDLGFD